MLVMEIFIRRMRLSEVTITDRIFYRRDEVYPFAGAKRLQPGNSSRSRKVGDEIGNRRGDHLDQGSDNTT